MLWMLGAIACIFLGGLCALVDGENGRRASLWAFIGLCAAAVFALPVVFKVLLTGITISFQHAWSMPFGSLGMALDPLSAFFMLPVLLLGPVFALYGRGYMAHYRDDGRKHGWHWFFFNILSAGMALVLLARNGLLFLLAWEVMSLAPFFLILFQDRRDSSRRAAWVYLVAAHLGGIFLLIFFLLLGQGSSSLDFAAVQPQNLNAAARNVLFVLALIGFGSKAGIVPLHVWLPEAHPAAPSHVSAYMSGVMIKMGIYGILRAILLLGGPPLDWGILLILLGAVSGIMGVLFALAQHDLKRLLAYHSVENIGIILLGLGAGCVGLALKMPAIACLGFAGGLLHVLNHSIFKGLLFLGAGSVQHSASTLELDELGGLVKRMPWTAATFIIGAVAICGLPPLNGFISEFLIYASAITGTGSLLPITTWPMLLLIASLALIGGLAAACFAKACGIVFLGEPRSRKAAKATEAVLSMRLAMVLLAVFCFVIGLAAPPLMRLLNGPLATLAPGLNLQAAMGQWTARLGHVCLIAFVLLMVVSMLSGLRYLLLRQREVTAAPTWGCGYLYPSARMQYTASSFARPITRFVNTILQNRIDQQLPESVFAGSISLSSSTPDLFRQRLFSPLFVATARLLGLLRWMQHGRVQLYILYIVVTLLCLIGALTGGLI